MPNPLRHGFHHYRATGALERPSPGFSGGQIDPQQVIFIDLDCINTISSSTGSNPVWAGRISARVHMAADLSRLRKVQLEDM